ncbi:O-antigen ligase family protein [Paenibacillus sp.]|uniref:O-antigen ligase family protein n=1 Tax=Paenibacillus sp. TaxID=58172 RepID=UPI002D3A3488|nr:O-antigen ligase family protein [Paenibacillus sp.]HZG86168.1 O-antigen ligase family protein [Paenibacillus sp.]
MGTSVIRTSKQNMEVRKSINFWVASFVLAGVLLISPFSRGLFNGEGLTFLTPILNTALWVSIILFCIAIYSIYFAKWDWKSGVWKSAIWLIPLSYLISTMQPASQSNSNISFLIALILAVGFLIGLHWNQSDIGSRTLLTVIFSSGYLVVLFGMANWFGNASFFGLIDWSNDPFTSSKVYTDAVMYGYEGARLTSVFQYSNSYAAFLIALWIASLLFLVQSNKFKLQIICAFMVTPIVVSLLLTLSRGAYLIAPIVIVMILPFLHLKKQYKFLIYLFSNAIISFVTYKVIEAKGLALQQNYNPTNYLIAWLIFIGLSLVFSVIVYVVEKWFSSNAEETSSPILKRIIVPIALVALSALTAVLLFTQPHLLTPLPDALENRIKNINLQQHSLLERVAFYKDAVKMIQDKPIIGAGGGAWSELYEKYQGNPYTSRQAHNFILQLVVETGMIGLVSLLTVLFFSIRQLIRSYSNHQIFDNQKTLLYFSIFLSLFIHSLIDFDFSYVYLSFIAFICLGAFSTSPFVHVEEGNVKTITSVKRFIYPGFLFSISLVIFAISVSLLSGMQTYSQARKMMAESNPLPQIIKTFNEALSKIKHPEVYYQKTYFLAQAYQHTSDPQYLQQALDTIIEARNREPYNKDLFLMEYQLSGGQSEASFELLEKNISNYQWDIQMYEYFISHAFQIGYSKLQTNDIGGAEKYWRKSIQKYSEVLDKIATLENLPAGQYQGRPFSVTKPIALNVSHIYYLTGSYENALETIMPLVNPELTEPIDHEIVLLNLAAQHQIGNDPDPNLLQGLVSKNSEYQNRYDAMINQSPVEIKLTP